ncbi:MAG: hypothetical protein ABIZ80_19795 [Bryobacteraceae bacterium]
MPEANDVTLLLLAFARGSREAGESQPLPLLCVGGDEECPDRQCSPGGAREAGGKSPPLPVRDDMLVSTERTEEILAIDEALTRLKASDARMG